MYISFSSRLLKQFITNYKNPPRMALPMTKLTEPSNFRSLIRPRDLFTFKSNKIKQYFFFNKIKQKRNSLKAALSFNLEETNNLIDSIGLNPENSNTYTNLNELFKAIDSIAGNDVNAVTENFLFFDNNKFYLIHICICIIAIEFFLSF